MDGTSPLARRVRAFLFLGLGMIYTHHNARGATVYDVDTLEKIGRVREVDTETGEVVCHHEPIRVNHRGDDVETFTIRFTSIHPIFGGGQVPCLFHCYGRQA